MIRLPGATISQPAAPAAATPPADRWKTFAAQKAWPGLDAIAAAFPGGVFAAEDFLAGAGSAYEIIVLAFASGDVATLRRLLEKEVFESFESSIRAREAAGRKVDFTFVGLPKIEISQAALDKRNATVTVQFHAEVFTATHDKDGALIEGSPDQVKAIADEWTFARSPKSRDPNWKLVATNQLD